MAMAPSARGGATGGNFCQNGPRKGQNRAPNDVIEATTRWPSVLFVIPKMGGAGENGWGGLGVTGNRFVIA